MEKCEIKIVGVGGLGIRTAGFILGKAATLSGKYASHWPSYGVETRGGPSFSDIIISNQEIDFPRVSAPDILVAFSQAMLAEHMKYVKPGGILILDSELIKDKPTRTDVSVKRLPLLRIADALGQRVLVNVILLGFLTVILGMSKEAMLEAIATTLPNAGQEVVMQAFQEGIRLGEECKT